MGLIEDIKSDVKKSGNNKKKILYFKSGVKKRIRFLQEMDDGFKVPFHDCYDAGANYPCQELYDRDCPDHDAENFRHRNIYVWSVWDHENKEVCLLIGPVNAYSPIPNLLAMNESYDNITDRDYVITKDGKGTEQKWTVVPMDKSKFKNKDAKPYSEEKAMKILDKAFPCEDSDSDDDEDDNEEDKKKKKKAAKSDGKKEKKGKARDDDEDEDDDNDADDNDADEVDYDDMSPKDLYQLCKKRKIDVEQKKSKEYYIKKLDKDEADDDEDDGWDEDDE